MPTSNLRELEIGTTITVDNDYYRDIYVTPVSAGGEKTGNLTVVMNHRRDPFVLHNLAYSRYTVDNNRPRTSFMYARDATHPSLWTKTLVKAGGYVQLADDYGGVINDTNKNLHLIIKRAQAGLNIADVDVEVQLTFGVNITLTQLAADIQTKLRDHGAFAAVASPGIPHIDVTAIIDSDDPNYNNLELRAIATALETCNVVIGAKTTSGTILGFGNSPTAGVGTAFGGALQKTQILFPGVVPFTTSKYDGYAAVVQVKPHSNPDEFIMKAPLLDGIEVGSSVTLYNCSANKNFRLKINEKTGGDVGDFNTTKGGAGYFRGDGNSTVNGAASYYQEIDADATRLLVAPDQRVTLLHYRDEITIPSASYWLVTSTTVSTLPAEGA